MSRKTRAQERIESLDTSSLREPGTDGAAGGTHAADASAAAVLGEVDALRQEMDELRRRLETAEQESAENRTAWQRSAADFANYRRRTEQEREATLGLANEMLLLKLLAVVDDFDRALAAMPRELEHLGWVEGIWLVERKLRALLESEGVTPIEAQGRPFDPREHEAVVTEETTTAPEDTVLGELQRGYRIRDRILRPALVSVAKNPGQQAASGGRS